MCRELETEDFMTGHDKPAESPLKEAYKAFKELEMKRFTKDDLKDGMRLVLRDGYTYYVCGHAIVESTQFACSFSLNEYSDDLMSINGIKRLDVMKVIDRDDTVLLERKPKRKVTLELTDEQIERLKEQGVEFND